MKLYSLFPFCASLSNAAELAQTGLVLQHYGSDLLNSIMGLVGYSQQDSQAIANHGCWCGKLDKDHPYPELLGGHLPIDELDEICRDWFISVFRNFTNYVVLMFFERFEPYITHS